MFKLIPFHKPLILLFGALATPYLLAADKACQVTSAPEKTTVIELFTSDGCDSCPPANQWLASIVKSADRRVIPLSFHVTYWNYLGWKDQFSQSAFDARQSTYAKASPNPYSYTPEVFFNASELQAWRKREPTNVAKAPAEAAPLQIQVSGERTGSAKLEVATKLTQSPGATIDFSKSGLSIFLYEDKLVARPNAGELKGVALPHEHVVRSWKNLDTLAFGQTVRTTFEIPETWNPKNLGVVVMAQSKDLRVIHQAVDLPLCF